MRFLAGLPFSPVAPLPSTTLPPAGSGFFATPNQGRNRTGPTLQRWLVDRMVDYTLGCDHVLYLIDNEICGEQERGRCWTGCLSERAAAKDGRTVFVTEMCENWNPAASGSGALCRRPCPE